MISRIKTKLLRILWKLELVSARRYWTSLGARIAPNAHVSSEAFVDEKYAPLLTIEAGVVIAMGARFIMHDSSFCNVLGSPIRCGRILVRENAYVGANATILPGVTIGAGSLVGAGAIVTRSVPDGWVAAGSPARAVATVQDAETRFRNSVGGDRPFRWQEYPAQREKHRFDPEALRSAHSRFLADYDDA